MGVWHNLDVLSNFTDEKNCCCIKRITGNQLNNLVVAIVFCTAQHNPNVSITFVEAKMSVHINDLPNEILCHLLKFLPKKLYFKLKSYVRNVNIV